MLVADRRQFTALRLTRFGNLLRIFFCELENMCRYVIARCRQQAYIDILNPALGINMECSNDYTRASGMKNAKRLDLML